MDGAEAVKERGTTGPRTKTSRLPCEHHLDSSPYMLGTDEAVPVRTWDNTEPPNIAGAPNQEANPRVLRRYEAGLYHKVLSKRMLYTYTLCHGYMCHFLLPFSAVNVISSDFKF